NIYLKELHRTIEMVYLVKSLERKLGREKEENLLYMTLQTKVYKMS
ncbi:hypothetical protein TVAGG3_0103300, partial [Trichomonas vaginalis G3]